MIHSEKARQNIERQRQELKRQRQQQAIRNPYNDGYEFDPCADPRFVAHQRNKQAKELAKKQAQPASKKQQNQTTDAANKILKVIGANNIVKFIRTENVTV